MKRLRQIGWLSIQAVTILLGSGAGTVAVTNAWAFQDTVVVNSAYNAGDGTSLQAIHPAEVKLLIDDVDQTRIVGRKCDGRKLRGYSYSFGRRQS